MKERTVDSKLRTLQEKEDDVILKWLQFEPMTLEEGALALWMRDGRKTAKPMTRMGFLKLEQRILKKLRKACDKYGISLEDVLSLCHCGRTCAKEWSNREDNYGT